MTQFYNIDEVIVRSTADNIKANTPTTLIEAVYTETPVSGAKLPYVFVHLANTMKTPQFTGYYIGRFLIEVRGYVNSKSTNKQEWFREVGTHLFNILEFTDINGKPIRNQSVETRVIEDDVLQVLVVLDGIRLVKVVANNQVFMQALDLEVKPSL